MTTVIFAYVITQSTTELNRKLTKHSQNTLNMGVYTGEKYLCKNLGVKERGGHLLKGGVFSGTYHICNVRREVLNAAVTFMRQNSQV